MRKNLSIRSEGMSNEAITSRSLLFSGSERNCSAILWARSARSSSDITAMSRGSPYVMLSLLTICAQKLSSVEMVEREKLSKVSEGRLSRASSRRR